MSEILVGLCDPTLDSSADVCADTSRGADIDQRSSEILDDLDFSISEDNMRRIGGIGLKDCSLSETSSDIESMADKTERYRLRDLAITQLVKKFGDDPYVHRSLARQKNGKKFERSCDPFISIVREAASYKLLSQEDEQRHFSNIDEGVDLFNQGIDLDNLTPEQKRTVLDLVASRQVVAVSNLRLVYRLAKKFSAVHEMIPKVDLYQEGYIGLLRAINRHDVTFGLRFSTSASHYIFKSIAYEVANKSRIIRLPHGRHQQHRALLKKSEGLAQTLKREPNHNDISEHLGLKVTDVDELMQFGERSLMSLDKDRFDGGGTLEQTVSDKTATAELDEILNVSVFRQTIADIFDKADLDERQRIVLGLRAGLESFESGDVVFNLANGNAIRYKDLPKYLSLDFGLTFDEIGDIFGFTKQNASLIAAKALKKVRDAVTVSDAKVLSDCEYS